MMARELRYPFGDPVLLALPTKLLNALGRAGYRNANQLRRTHDRDLAKVYRVGRSGTKRIREVVPYVPDSQLNDPAVRR